MESNWNTVQVYEKFKQMLPKLESLNQQLALHRLPVAAVVAWCADHVCAVLLASTNITRNSTKKSCEYLACFKMEIPLLESLPIHYQYPHLESFSSYRNLALFTEVQMLDNRTRPQ